MERQDPSTRVTENTERFRPPGSRPVQSAKNRTAFMRTVGWGCVESSHATPLRRAPRRHLTLTLTLTLRRAPRRHLTLTLTLTLTLRRAPRRHLTLTLTQRTSLGRGSELRACDAGRRRRRCWSTRSSGGRRIVAVRSHSSSPGSATRTAASSAGAAPTPRATIPTVGSV